MNGSDHRTLWLASAWILAALGIVLGFALAGWPGESNGCFEVQHPVCFCERPRAGMVAQPSNTFSNLAFVAAGLWIATVADRWRRRVPPQSNPLTRTTVYPTTFAIVTGLLGPGSMFLHASMTTWGGRLDVWSMYLYAGLLIAYGVARLRGLSVAAFAASYVGILTVLMVATFVHVPVEPFFGILLGSAVVIEVRLMRRDAQRSIERRWALLAGVLFLTGFAIWIPSLSGGAWCEPERWIQGHAVWHLLCAAATVALFQYYRSERRGDARTS